MTRITFLFALSLILNGCAFGHKHSYHDIDIKFKGNNLSPLTVATLDSRSYILNGNKKPDFVGLQRGGYGIPFIIKTTSGNPLAEDMTYALVQSLKRYKVNAIPVATQHGNSIETVHSKLLKKGTNQSLLLVLREWKSDTMNRTALIYDVTLSVLNSTTGEVLAEKSIKGNENLGIGFNFLVTDHAKKFIPFAFKKKMEFLLNNRKILKALQ